VFWRHVVASTVPDPETGLLRGEADSLRYWNEQTRMIFEQGFSFSGFERNRVYISRPGEGSGRRFVDITDVSGGGSDADTRGVAFADFDDDGDADIFFNTIQRRLHMLLRNDRGNVSGHHWLKLRLVGTRSNRDAVGAVVLLRSAGLAGIHAKMVTCGSGFQSQHDAELIFGLGAATQADHVEIRWPSGLVQQFTGLRADSRYLITEADAIPELRRKRWEKDGSTKDGKAAEEESSNE
jgi:hypothetical protein